jgi:SAM-dependent methyltransferase
VIEMTQTTQTSAIETLKEAHRATWDSGDYGDVADRYVTPLGEVAIERAAIDEGTVLLDVATGSGNVAIPAAKAGARVTGIDLSPRLIDQAREIAGGEAVEAEFIVGDAEALPFEDDAYDVVTSVVGVQFAPQHEVAAAEIARVVRPGGRVVICSWTPSGFLGQFLKTVSPRMPAPPEGASPPPLWGDAEHVTKLFAEHGVTFEYEHREAEFDHDSAAAFVDYMAAVYGPLLKARERLSETGEWDELRSELIELSDRFDAGDERFCARSEYLVAEGVAAR